MLDVRVARRLERGSARPLSRAAGRLWGTVATVRRPLELPPGAGVVGIGSAVLGGAGKTPVAIAVVRELARRGARVAFVGHAYRARPGRARIAAPTDAVSLVGDDALWAARALAGVAPVVVAPTRQGAVDLAASLGATVLVVDGLLQTRPRPLRDAVLILDAGAPWGAGACPPAGDLRAPPNALLAAASAIALVTAEGEPRAQGLPAAIAVRSSLSTARDAAGRAYAIASLRGMRVGVMLAIARPERVLRALDRAGIAAVRRQLLADHAVPRTSAVARGPAVDVWLTTHRCATKLPPRLGPAPVLALDHDLDVGPLTDALHVATQLSTKSVVGSRPCGSDEGIG